MESQNANDSPAFVVESGCYDPSSPHTLPNHHREDVILPPLREENVREALVYRPDGTFNPSHQLDGHDLMSLFPPQPPPSFSATRTSCNAMSELFGSQERSFLTGEAARAFLTDGDDSYTGIQWPETIWFPEDETARHLTGPGIPGDQDDDVPTTDSDRSPPAPPTSPVQAAPYGLEEMGLNEWVDDDRDMFSHLLASLCGVSMD
ncbi:hypothetical protein ONZ45_g10880 [Pleurotus djamor]|nr:hypothetical protein ONZ45_g10880 [Pleurotus djamor]